MFCKPSVDNKLAAERLGSTALDGNRTACILFILVFFSSFLSKAQSLLGPAGNFS